MARISGTQCSVWLNGHRFSGDISSFDIATSRSMLRKPNLAHRAQVRLPGLGDFELTVRLWVSAGDTEWLDFVNLPSKDDRTGFIIAFGTEPGDLVFAGNGLVNQASWRRGDDGSLGGSCTIENEGSGAGWFRLALPAPSGVNVLIAGKRVSAAFPMSLVLPHSDVLIWSSSDINAVDAAKWDLALSQYVAGGAAVFSTRASSTLFHALPDSKLVTVLKDFGSLANVASTGFMWRMNWSAASPYAATEFILASGIALGS